MKKSFVIMFFVLFLVNMANAQVLIAILFGDKLSSDKFELGIRLTENFAGLTNITDSKTRPGLGFGLYGTFKMTEKISLQPELFFRSPMGAKGISPVLPGDPNLDPLLVDADVATQLTYISIPVIAKYSFRENVSFGIGPQFGILTSAKNKYVAEVFEAEDLVFKDNIKSQLQSFDFGLVFNLEYKLQRKKGMNVNLRYYLGLTDTIRNNPGDAVKNSVIQIAVGIPMGKKEKDE